MRRRYRFAFVTIFVALALGSVASPADAQSTMERRPRSQLLRDLRNFADSLAAPPAYTRERFVYPRFGRADPVMPPPVIAQRDESLPSLFLSAILIDHDDESRSVAIVRVGGQHGEQRRVSTGDRIGEIEIRQIDRSGVVIAIHSLDRVQLDTLTIAKPTSSNRAAP